MNKDLLSLSARDKAILVGLFLSRFDKKALSSLGFSGFMEAYNVLGYSLQINPLAIRGYRDEFDPYFPNPRKGWHKRGMRDYLKEMMDATSHLSFEEFRNLIDSFFFNQYVDIKDIKLKEKHTRKEELLYSRLMTGRAAEEYFVLNYNTVPAFKDYQLTDTTLMGCGFDYKLSLREDNFYVEVKGLNERQGSILMTEKEYNMADVLSEKFCLFVVSNFKEKPFHQLFFNPLNNERLVFQRNERSVLQVSYSANILQI